MIKLDAVLLEAGSDDDQPELVCTLGEHGAVVLKAKTMTGRLEKNINAFLTRYEITHHTRICNLVSCLSV
ncbi:MAG: hypothetical protein V3T23_02145 [Nitrososphaerales archaeon]